MDVQQTGAQVWLDQFAGYLEVERNYSSNTIRAYMNDLKQLIENDSKTESTESVAKSNNSSAPVDASAASMDFSPESSSQTVAGGVDSEVQSGKSSGLLEADSLRAYIHQIQENYSPSDGGQKNLGYSKLLQISPPRTIN